ncbi:MAG TPA: hypothetical protein VJS92_05685 [Candidatus Polarisedimenticolaceae bacterium]|nr:hypothetical protein [Candidatus Polarisedimenticolaceae bacterium]
MSRRGIAAAVAALALALLAAHAASFLPFLSDDALISLRYARRLLDGHGLTWNDGERVEGYSNLLWVVLAAGLGRLGVELIAAVRVLGLASAAAAVLAVLRARRDEPPAWVAGFAAALASPLAAWAIGGLEQPLVVALLAWALVLVERATWIPGLLLALLCWTRPDGALLAGAVALGLVAARHSLGRVGKLLVLPALAYLGQLAFRLGYYGDWFPNPAYAKLAWSAQRWLEGLRYLGSGALWMVGLVVPALGLAWHRPTARVRLLLVPLVLWSVYVVAIGGDLFPARRQLVPLVVLLALLLAEGLANLAERSRARAWQIGLLSLGVLGTMQALDPQAWRARGERWEWDGEAVGQLLATAFHGARPLLACDPAGTLPYFSELPAVDMLGINDRFLARHRPADFGRGWQGHELGNGEYVLGREPDLVVFCGPAGGERPCYRSGKEMVADPRFRQRYRLTTLVAERPRRVVARIWARFEGGRVGVRREARRVVVPGYLFTANAASAARLDGQGRLGVAVSAQAPAGLPSLALEPGSWKLRLEGEGEIAGIAVRRARGPALARGAGDGLSFELGSAQPIDVLVGAAPGREFFLRQAVFSATREAEAPHGERPGRD